MSDFRIGHGYDLHRLQPAGRLVLAGVVVSEEMSPVAHSDGDVALHAVVDAVLGAAGLGDIGEHFPDTAPRWKGQASSLFVEHAVALAKAAGLRVVNADVTILVERPKLKPFKTAMVESLRRLLGTPNVNIKAGTNEGVDAIGRGEALACHAVVLLGPLE